MKKLLRELFYDLGYGIESLYQDSDSVDKFYREKIGRLSGKEIKNLFENSGYKEIKDLSNHTELQENSFKAFPFHFRMALKQFYAINGTHKPYPYLGKITDKYDEQILKKTDKEGSYNPFDII